MEGGEKKFEVMNEQEDRLFGLNFLGQQKLKVNFRSHKVKEMSNSVRN